MLFVADVNSVEAAKRQRRSLDVADKKVRKKQTKIPKSSQDRINRRRVLGIKLEAKLVRGIDRTIRYLDKTAVRLPKKSKSRFRTYEKIINLLMEQAVFVARQEERNYDASWSRWVSNGRRGREPRLDNRKSKRYWLNIVQRTRKLIKEYPKVPEVPELLFQQGLALEFASKTKESVRVLKKLVKKYPGSPVVGEAYYSLGDYDFERLKFSSARRYYQRALKYKRSRRYGWARFKIGWCLFNEGKHRKAVNSWKATVAYSRKIGGETGRQLRDETLRDMVYGFAELRSVDEAIRYFRRNSGMKYVVDFLSLLGDTYYNQGQFSRSIKVWRRLQVIVPNHPKAANAQSEILSLLYHVKKYKNLQSELVRYRKKYGPRSRWASRNPETRGEIAKDIEEQSIYYAKRLHKDGQIGASSRAYLYAKKLYLQYMKLYPRSQKLMEVRENLADIEYFSNRFREAGNLYRTIVSAGPDKAWILIGKRKQSIHRRSADNMLDAYNRAFAGELQKLSRKKPNFSKKPVPLSRNAKNFIESCGTYKRFYPKVKKQNKTCHLFVTEVYYRAGYRKQATEGMWGIIKRYPREKVASESVARLLQMNKVNAKDLIATIERVLKIPAYARGSNRLKLEKLLRATIIDDISKEKNPLVRARRYESVAKRRPRSPDAPNIWISSADSYLQAGDLNAAIAAYAVIVRRYPRSKVFKSATIQLAKIEDRRLNWDKAAQYYMIYAKRFGRDPDALGAQRRACVLLMSTSVSQAVSYCQGYLRNVPSDASGLWPLLVDIAWRSKRYDVLGTISSPRTLQQFQLSPSEKIVAMYRLYSTQPVNSQSARIVSQAIFSQAGAGGLEGEALRIVAGLLFRQTGKPLAILQSAKLQGGSINTLQVSLESVSQAIPIIEQQYDQVLSVGDPYWGVAAFYQKGVAYETMANLVASPPKVSEFSEKDLKTQLAPLTNDMRTKAAEQYSLALELSNKFRVHNEWVVKLEVAKKRLEGKSRSFDEVVVLPDFIGSRVDKDIFEATR